MAEEKKENVSVVMDATLYERLEEFRSRWMRKAGFLPRAAAIRILIDRGLEASQASGQN